MVNAMFSCDWDWSYFGPFESSQEQVIVVCPKLFGIKSNTWYSLSRKYTLKSEYQSAPNLSSSTQRLHIIEAEILTVCLILSSTAYSSPKKSKSFSDWIGFTGVFADCFSILSSFEWTPTVVSLVVNWSFIFSGVLSLLKTIGLKDHISFQKAR